MVAGATSAYGTKRHSAPDGYRSLSGRSGQVQTSALTILVENDPERTSHTGFSPRIGASFAAFSQPKIIKRTGASAWLTLRICAVLEKRCHLTLRGKAMAKGKTAPAVPEYVDKTFGRINDSGSRSETVARIVAFSDGVVAIIITIMVLELKTPFLEGNIHGAFDFSFLAQTGPKFLAYIISFAFVATMWFAHVSVMR